MKTLLLFVTIFFVFGWKITPLIDIIFLMSIVLVCAVFLMLRAPIDKHSLLVSQLLFALSVYALLITVLNGAVDTYVALRSIRAAINFLGGTALAWGYWRLYRQDALRVVCLHLFVVLTLHALLIVAMYINEYFRQWVYEVTSAHANVNLNMPFLLGYRITGLTYGLAQTSVVQMFGVLLVPVVWRHYCFSIAHALFISAGMFVLITSIFLTGRSGLFLLVILLPIVLILGSRRMNLKRRGNLVRMISLIVVGGLFMTLLINVADYENVRYTLTQAEEVIRVFSDEEGTVTTNALSRMYFIPGDAVEFIFGSSNMGRGGDYITSDVGYVLLMHAIGIFGVSIMLLPFAYGVYVVWKSRQRDNMIAAAILCIFIASVLLNFKEVALMTRNQWSVQSLLLCAWFVHLVKCPNNRFKFSNGLTTRSSTEI